MTTPLRVLHFQGRLGKGGAETFMMNTYRNIDRSKIQFDFVVYDDFIDIQPYNEEIKDLGGRIFVVPNPKKNIISYIVSVRKLLKAHTFDIVHNEVFFGGGINLLLAKRAGINKRIAHSHATSDGKTNLIFKILRKPLDSLLLKVATDFIACSTEAGKALFGESQSFRFVPNGIDLDMYRNVETTRIKKLYDTLGIPVDATVIGNIGRFEDQKNHVFLIDIFKEIVKKDSNCHLLLIGEGSLEQKIKQKVKDNGLERKVHFLGIRNDIPELLALMDVFLMPSLYEGLPISAVEAQAAGAKLVLSSEVSKETRLSENVQFISLDTSSKEWADRVLQEPFKNLPLEDLEEYDMHQTAQLMEEIYLDQGE